MKSQYKYILSFISILLVILACTKQVGLYTEVEFELTETHVSESYINTALATAITVSPEELVEGYNYIYSYKINNGSGYFEDESGTSISEGEKIALDPLTASLNYIPTEVGDHTIVFTAEDSFGFTEQVIVTYSISDIPVTWTARESTGQLLIGDTETVTIVLGSETEEQEVTYERNYSFTEGTGTLTTSEGVDETLGEFIEITPGTYELEFTATEVGIITIEFLLKDSNEQEYIESVTFESFEIPGTISSEKEITSFSINDVYGTITDTTIDIELPAGTDLTALTPTIVHTGVSVNPASETSQDFSNPIMYVVTAEDSSTQEYTVTVTSPTLSTTNSITQFTIDGVEGTITDTDIALTLPAGTDVSALTPTIVHTGETISPASGVAQDFTDPVIYTVTAEDSSTQEYTVTVTSPTLSTTNSITQFTIHGVDGTITGTDIALTLPAGTDVSALTPTIVHTGETISPASGTAQDFTDTVVYSVTAKDSSTQEYTVTVTSPTLNTTNSITQFTIDEVEGTITDTDIALTLPAGTDVSSLTPTIVHTGETISPASDVAQDFSNPVVYTVTAEDNSIQEYTITVMTPMPFFNEITGELYANAGTEITIRLVSNDEGDYGDATVKAISISGVSLGSSSVSWGDIPEVDDASFSFFMPIDEVVYITGDLQTRDSRGEAVAYITIENFSASITLDQDNLIFPE
ncbi:DUF5018 domain-containing protein [Cellulophaga baltica]|uniref:DUF5018 domain-containing protein n=1 Tax=Cellulophaga TaxID=104264 RepID=UPI001C06E78C|nr:MULTISPECIES: DUF5018 domain-containing protein [Cellulophaga]MBU2997458.1 DUF5018 domain-containing protein [Cellulophaga baltica]MDO6768855.1 DUF5018 domain-containing protein [Cellulophaga sp. 1_MG-2023]